MGVFTVQGLTDLSNVSHANANAYPVYTLKCLPVCRLFRQIESVNPDKGFMKTFDFEYFYGRNVISSNSRLIIIFVNTPKWFV